MCDDITGMGKKTCYTMKKGINTIEKIIYCNLV